MAVFFSFHLILLDYRVDAIILDGKIGFSRD